MIPSHSIYRDLFFSHNILLIEETAKGSWMDIFPSDESKLILFGMATSGPKKAIAYSRGPDR